MTQVNKYTDKSAYDADTTRDRKMSSVSLIENNNELVYDGVNMVVDKPSAGIGDLVVYDTILGKIRYVKSILVNKENLPATLVPMAVVYGRKGDKVLIVSFQNAFYNDSTSIRWAASYEVAFRGFDFVNGGTFTIKINVTDYSFTYPAGSTPKSIADIIAAELPNYNVVAYGGWTAVAWGGEVIMTSNTNSAAYSTIDAVSGCAIRRRPEDVNYQTTLTGVLIEGSIEYIRRNNRVNSSFAGCNPEMFLQYFAVNGSAETGLFPGNPTIIKESVFTEADNPRLVAAYPTYRDYLLTEHMLQYPAAYGAMLRDGKINTSLIGPLRFVDIRGNSVARYPAVAAALDYGIAVDGYTTGLEAGAWWLPSADEIHLLMRDRVLTAADVERDPVNRTLSRLGKATCYGSGYYPWTSCECNAESGFSYRGGTGYAGSIHKIALDSVRPVSAL